MGDTIFQKRTYELEEFTPLIQGEPGYEDPSVIWLPCDKLGWAEAKKLSLVEFITNLHKEQGPVTLTGVNVAVIYGNEFQTNNYYIRVDTYRTYNVPGVGIISENIPIKNFSKSISGFTLTLESYQVGDVLNFIAFE
jgi:hypothetical protein